MIVIFVVLPTILVWTIGFPFFTFLMLRRKRLNLDEKDNVIKYGLFYIGLRDETYYWECLVSNGRKIAISVIIASINEKQAHT